MNKSEKIFRDFCYGYKIRDIKFILSLFSKNSTMLGSGKDEYRVGIDEIKQQILRDWSQSEKGEIEINQIISNSNDNWISAICTAFITVGNVEHILTDLRGTIIIVEENSQFKILHMHASFPDYRNPENNSFPIK